jgi:hypothetical protein
MWNAFPSPSSFIRRGENFSPFTSMWRKTLPYHHTLTTSLEITKPEGTEESKIPFYSILNQKWILPPPVSSVVLARNHIFPLEN